MGRRKLAVFTRGEDKPGVSYEFSQCVLRPRSVVLLDIGQMLIEKICCLYYVFLLDEDDIVCVMKNFLLSGKNVNHEVEFKLLDDSHLTESEHSVSETDSVCFVCNIVQLRPTLSVTLLIDLLYAMLNSHVKVISIQHETVCFTYSNVQTIKMKCRANECEQPHNGCSLLSNGRVRALYEEVQGICWRNEAEVVFLREGGRRKQLAVFGMCETLIKNDLIDVMLGCGNVDRKQFDELNLPLVDTLKEKIASLKGQPCTLETDAMKKIALTDGASVVCKALKFLGYELVLITHGFDACAQYIGKLLNFDIILNNHLEIQDGYYTGRVSGWQSVSESSAGWDSHMMHHLRKLDWLQLLVEKKQITAENVIIIGDYKHADYLYNSCDFKINFNANHHHDLRTVLLLMGFSRSDVSQFQNVLFDKEPFSSLCAMEDPREEQEPQIKATVCLYGSPIEGAFDRIAACLSRSTQKNLQILHVERSDIKESLCVGVTLLWRPSSSSHRIDSWHSIPFSPYLSENDEDVGVLKDLVFLASSLPLKIQFELFANFLMTNKTNDQQREKKEKEKKSLLILDNITQDNTEIIRINGSSSLREEEQKASSSFSLNKIVYDKNDNETSPYLMVVMQKPTLKTDLLAATYKLLATENINITAIQLLSEGSPVRVLQFKLSTLQPQVALKIKSDLLALSVDFQADVSLEKDCITRYCRRLVIFDMDSTLIQQEVVDELARHVGVEQQVSEITNEAMCGKLQFEESLQARVRLLKGAPVGIIDDVLKEISLTPGARELCAVLRFLGFRLAVVSGGFTQFVEFVKNELLLDHAFANRLEIDEEGRMTGNLTGPIVTPERKASLMRMMSDIYGCSLDQVIGVGDGANDIPMLLQAGMGVAFCAKPRVQEKAEFRLNTRNLSNILYLIGIPEQLMRRLGK